LFKVRTVGSSETFWRRIDKREELVQQLKHPSLKAQKSVEKLSKYRKTGKSLGRKRAAALCAESWGKKVPGLENYPLFLNPEHLFSQSSNSTSIKFRLGFH
jgi:hypothetical protein